MKAIIVLLLFTFGLNNSSWSQSQAELVKHADEVIKPFSDPLQPGLSGAIIEKGKIVYLKAQGLANPFTNEEANLQTLYPVDAISKQFTTLAFLTLLEEGQINLNDPIVDHLPDWPTLNKEIRVSHVLNHTTGLYSYYITNILLGNGDDNIKTNNDAMAIISLQTEFPHAPGDRFSIFNSDTESVLMSEIIASVSEMSFAEYVDTKVFKPLGLVNASFVDDISINLKNQAMSFELASDTIIQRPVGHNIVGPSGLYISIEDMATWYSFFSQENNEIKYDLVKKLDTKVKNNRGDILFSTWGQMTYGRSHLHAERGVPKYWQFGMVGAYGANLFRYPEQDITSIAIGNNDQYNGSPAMDMLTPLMEAHYKFPPQIDKDLIESIDLSVAQLERWNGKYFDKSNGEVREIVAENDTLRYIRNSGKVSLVPLTESKFQALVESDEVVIFSFGEEDGYNTYGASFAGSDPLEYTEFDMVEYSSQDLEEFEGLYVNEDFGQVYRIDTDGISLNGQHVKNGAFTFSPIIKDVFKSDLLILGLIKFERSANEVVSFTVNNWGFKNITFEKVK